MHCFDCPEENSAEVVGLCHHCGAALCRSHAASIPESLYVTESIVKRVALPHSARLILCQTCRTAFDEQRTATLTGTATL